MNKKYHKKFFQLIPSKIKQGIAGTMALQMLFASLFTFIPNQSFALTGGPSQPEVQSFEPMGANNMVNNFSGDFTYNIPLLDVEGYPINLAYNSGVTMDQEASWVGLGWNINVGTINRGLRGIPDDFNGDDILTETNIRPNRSVNITGGFDTEIFGKKLENSTTNLSASANLGINYNNYTGVGLSIGGGLNFSDTKSPLSLGLGFSSSSDNGLSISPSLGLSIGITNKETEEGTESLNGKIGLSSSFNNRSGLKNLSINTSVNNTANSYSEKAQKMVQSSVSGGVGSSYSMGQQTYTPAGGIDMNSFSISGRYKLGIEAYGADGGVFVEAGYSSQWLTNESKSKNSPSYGYFYTEKGQNNDQALLDFNREKDGIFSNSTPALPITNYTNDIFSVSGQGVGGSYRAYKNEISYVGDPNSKSTGTSVSLGGEYSPGGIAHAGADVGVVINTSKSSKWESDNQAYNGLKHSVNNPYPDYEPYHLREANEMSVNVDPNYYYNIGADEATRLSLNTDLLFKSKLENKFETSNGSKIDINSNTRKQREKRNNIIQTKTVGQVLNGLGFNGQSMYPAGAHAYNAKPHHIGEIISLGTDGMRYVYGIPAYNKEQHEVTFSVGEKVNGEEYDFQADYSTGLIMYNIGDNSINNENGIDRYFQRKKIPAYAHSFLLTSVVSPDYVDLDNNGPSPKDLGTYTKFDYTQISDYQWRVPVQENYASFNPGLNSDNKDDKANYIYGKKELWYLDKIETKNFIAIFHKSPREDGKGVSGENGGITLGDTMLKLDSIILYSKPDYDKNGTNATSLKQVHFEYDYELCPGIPNNVNGGGKLTLKKVFFTYRSSLKGKLSPYVFKYNTNDNGTILNNYAYNLKGYDRWGCYQPNLANSNFDALSSPLGSMEFPYVEQDKSKADLYTAAWALSEIQLPSGGNIKVNYESDDYAFVQNREAMQMAKIISVGDDNNSPQGIVGFNAQSLVGTGISGNKNRRIFFEADLLNYDVNDYFKNIDLIYFKAFMKFFDEPKGYDYVPGYAKIKSYGKLNDNVGYIDLEGVSLENPAENGDYSPIAVASAQFARMHLAQKAWGSPLFDDNESFGAPLLKTVYQTFVENFKDGFKNPNKAMLDKQRGRDLVTHKSFIRLNNVSKTKLGGGCRVSSVKMNDNWQEMTSGIEDKFDYGQEYDYTETYIENGAEKTRSSGVASYEPQIGGDENPFKQPYFYSREAVLAPDDRFYQEEPFGESFFPSASVGYSKVSVRNLQRTNVTRHATGKVVHEFYTCKDYPTITKMTGVDSKRSRISPFSVLGLLNFDSKDYFAASQGFVVELNDMNGKPKSQKVYQEDKIQPITEVEYFYKDIKHSVAKNGIKAENKINDPNSRKLTNNVPVIYQNGKIENSDIGITFDAVADFRQSTNKTLMPSANINLDVFVFGPVPAAIPTIWPSYRQQRTRFRSAGFTKVINRFGILEKTVAKDLGSVVETKNLAYDAETGEVLLTETTTNFDDKIYTLNYPAYWHYDNMGPAYKNIGFRTPANISGGTFSANAKYFVEGDEVILYYTQGGVFKKAWVVNKNGNEVALQLFDGSIPNNGNVFIEITRSGRKNMQMQNMASITTLINPLNTFNTNLYENVIQASAIEFNDEWRTYCDCFYDENGENITYNPYVLGTKGNWRPIRSYLPLSDRIQSDINNNTNIRKDGVFERYRPYYNLENGKWIVKSEDWTFTSSVTEFNPYGQEVENQDALGRYSSAMFGFNQTLTKAVAANARVREIGFTSFEDDDFSECADNHFKFNQDNLVRDQSRSHTGRYSIKVGVTTPATLSRDIDWCDPYACELDVNTTQDGNLVRLTPVNAVGNTTLDWELLAGDIPIGFEINNLNRVEFESNHIFTIVLNWKDEKGCITSYKLSSITTTNDFELIKLK